MSDIALAELRQNVCTALARDEVHVVWVSACVSALDVHDMYISYIFLVIFCVFCLWYQFVIFAALMSQSSAVPTLSTYIGDSILCFKHFLSSIFCSLFDALKEIFLSKTDFLHLYRSFGFNLILLATTLDSTFGSSAANPPLLCHCLALFLLSYLVMTLIKLFFETAVNYFEAISVINWFLSRF